LLMPPQIEKKKYQAPSRMLFTIFALPIGFAFTTV
jgi:hypothetical protein